MGTQLEDAHHRSGEIPPEIAANIKELFPEDEDFDFLQCQESVFLSLQTNSRSNSDRPSDHDQNSDQRSVPGNVDRLSRSGSFDLDLDLDEAVARSLQLEEDGFENLSISESTGAAAGNTGASSSATSVLAAIQDDVDPDTMSYEQLQSLGEIIGTESKGLSEEEISKLPSQKYKSGFFSRKSKFAECVICSMEFTKGEWLTALSCVHEYHTDCIKRWLRGNKTCPLCKNEVSES